MGNAGAEPTNYMTAVVGGSMGLVMGLAMESLLWIRSLGKHLGEVGRREAVLTTVFWAVVWILSAVIGVAAFLLCILLLIWGDG